MNTFIIKGEVGGLVYNHQKKNTEMRILYSYNNGYATYTTLAYKIFESVWLHVQ